MGAMGDVTNELMYELMKRIHHEMSEMHLDLGEVKRELNIARIHMAEMQSDIDNVYGVMGRQDLRLDRIERRLEIGEFAEPQRPFDPR